MDSSCSITSGLRSRPSFTASWAMTDCSVRRSRMALRDSGVSGWPELALCLAMRSTIAWLMGSPLTVAATGPVALLAEAASLSAWQAPKMDSEAAAAKSIAEGIRRTGHSLGGELRQPPRRKNRVAARGDVGYHGLPRNPRTALRVIDRLTFLSPRQREAPLLLVQIVFF